MSPKIWCPETLSPTQIIFPSALWYVHYWNKKSSNIMSNSSQMDEKKRNLLKMSRGFSNEWPFKTRSCRGWILVFVPLTLYVHLWPLWGEQSADQHFQNEHRMSFSGFQATDSFPMATDSTCKCSCILVLILLLVAQFMASNDERESTRYMCTSGKESTTCTSNVCSVVKQQSRHMAHTADHWPHKTL